jgi:NADH-quinone oxidoreductase subunit H
MTQAIDQIFVLTKHWLVGLVPVGAQPLCSAILSVAAIIIVFAT